MYSDSFFFFLHWILQIQVFLYGSEKFGILQVTVNCMNTGCWNIESEQFYNHKALRAHEQNIWSRRERKFNTNCYNGRGTILLMQAKTKLVMVKISFYLNQNSFGKNFILKIKINFLFCFSWVFRSIGFFDVWKRY